MSVVRGYGRRTVLVSALHGMPVAASMADALGELGGLGLISVARPCPAGFDVLLSPAGRVEARRQWAACWWRRWREAARQIDGRAASTYEERRRLSRLAKRARGRALVAFETMTGGAHAV